MVYALADRGARMLTAHNGLEFANIEWSRKNRAAGRPFIEHRLEIADFALRCATHRRDDVRLIPPDEIVAGIHAQARGVRTPAMKARVSNQGVSREIGVVADFVFGLQLANGSRRHFMVEIDRGTMPVSRSDFAQSSFEHKMRAYLTAHAAKQHERHFGWKTFRVLTVTTDEHHMRSMMDELRRLHVPHSMGPALFLFATRAALRASNRLAYAWRDGTGRHSQLV
jgi:hypothetical protein